MSNNIKSRGFTIVELLIVIVVIAILATISIVAYNGIQNRGKTSAGQSLAGQIAKKVEAYNTIQSAYPTRTELVNNYNVGTTTASTNTQEAKIDDINSAISADVTADTAKGGSVVTYQKCATSGAVVKYWDYSKASGNLTTVNIGSVSGACS